MPGRSRASAGSRSDARRALRRAAESLPPRAAARPGAGHGCCPRTARCPSDSESAPRPPSYPPQPAAPRDLALNRHAHHPFEHSAEEVALQELPQADEGLAVGHRTAAQAAEVPVRDAAAYLPLELLVAPGLEMLEHQQP